MGTEHILMDWQTLKVKQSEDLAKASNTVHHAAQPVTIAGKYLLPEKDDDSHTSMRWLASKNWLIGNVIRFPDVYLHVVFDYATFSILIVDENFKILNRNSIDQKTKDEMFNWVKNTLCNYGIDAELLHDKLHFELPDHEADEGIQFKKPDDIFLKELAAYRTNGHLMISKFSKEFATAQPVRIWPHHFDEGCYVPLLFEANEVIGSISFGMAVADEYYDTPYLYVTAWKNDEISYENPPELVSPGKWHQTDWNGQVLPGAELVELSPEEQALTAYEFMKQAINNARSLVGWVYK